MSEAKGTITIKNPLLGWISNPTGGSFSHALQGKDGQYSYSNGVSLFRSGRLGHIAPGRVFTAITDVDTKINQLPVNGAMASTSKAYVVLQNGRLVRLAANDGSSTEDYEDVTVHGGHSAGTASRNPDVLVLRDLAATPVEYALWSWQDATDGDVAIATLDLSSTVDYDWFSTLSGSGALRKNVPLKMFKAPDGSVCITNGSSLARADITGAIASATGSAARLNFGPGWTAMGGCAWKNYAVVIGQDGPANDSLTAIRRGTVRVWFWNMTDDNFTFSVDIPDNCANGIFFDGTTLSAYTNGRNGTSKKWEWNGAEFVLAFETATIPVSATPIQGAIDSYQGSTVIATNNQVYRNYKGGFHADSLLTDGTNFADQTGMLQNLYQGALYAGIAYGSTYKIFYEATTKYYGGTTIYFVSQLYELPYKANIKRLRLRFSQFGSGASIIFSLFRGYDTLSVGGAADLVNTTLSYASHGTLREKNIEKTITDVGSFYVVLTFNHASISDVAAIVEQLEIDWATSSQ